MLIPGTPLRRPAGADFLEISPGFSAGGDFPEIIPEIFVGGNIPEDFPGDFGRERFPADCPGDLRTWKLPGNFPGDSQQGRRFWRPSKEFAEDASSGGDSPEICRRFCRRFFGGVRCRRFWGALDLPPEIRREISRRFFEIVKRCFYTWWAI